MKKRSLQTHHSEESVKRIMAASHESAHFLFSNFKTTFILKPDLLKL